MTDFKQILKLLKLDTQDIDADMVRSITVTKDDIHGGHRLSAVASYDNGRKFESTGDFQAPKAKEDKPSQVVVAPKAADAAKESKKS